MGSRTSSDAIFLPLYQQLARGNQPGYYNVHPLSAVVQTGRKSAVRTGDQYLPRDRTILVEPVQSDVCGGDPKTARSWFFRRPMVVAPDEVFVRINCENSSDRPVNALYRGDGFAGYAADAA